MPPPKPEPASSTRQASKSHGPSQFILIKMGHALHLGRAGRLILEVRLQSRGYQSRSHPVVGVRLHCVADQRRSPFHLCGIGNTLCNKPKAQSQPCKCNLVPQQPFIYVPLSVKDFRGIRISSNSPTPKTPFAPRPLPREKNNWRNYKPRVRARRLSSYTSP